MKLQVSNYKGYARYHITVPKELVKSLNLDKGVALRWELAPRNSDALLVLSKLHNVK
jgi:bifunctional DNA-binding transcriptional regulator/antitoxin component of YhaV-PrlF toxin-antitoxin module|tara:strand:+ start:314 stop:484 length:171 start_codon:yes stop_codon:yes gene_type:complete